MALRGPFAYEQSKSAQESADTQALSKPSTLLSCVKRVASGCAFSVNNNNSVTDGIELRCDEYRVEREKLLNENALVKKQLGAALKQCETLEKEVERTKELGSDLLRLYQYTLC